MSDFNAAIPTVLAHEGGYSNDPADSGGATNFGISLYWLKSLGTLQDSHGALVADVNHDGRVDISDIKTLTKDEAVEFYKTLWWDHYHFERIADQDVATKLFDTAVNVGGVTAVKMAQSALECFTPMTVDGVLGPITVQAINSISAEVFLCCFRNVQARRYADIVAADHSKIVFFGGWLKRAAS